MAFERITLPVKDPRNENIVPHYPADAAAWIWRKDHQPGCAEFFLSVDLDEAVDTECYITADNRYEWYCDEEWIGMGPDRGDVDHWAFAAYRMQLSAGPHTIRVRAWYATDNMPLAQLSCQPGFLFGVKDEAMQKYFNTGMADWSVRKIGGIDWLPGGWATGSALRLNVSGYFAETEWEEPDIMLKARQEAFYGGKAPGWRLCPSNLPEQMREIFTAGTVRAIIRNDLDKEEIPVTAEDCADSETGVWQEVLFGQKEITIPADTEIGILLDFENYFCAYPVFEITAGGNASVRLNWAESLQTVQKDVCAKGNRNEAAGKWMPSPFQYDVLEHWDGRRRRISTFWWRAGRYVLLILRSGDTPLTLHKLEFIECRYPLKRESSIEFSDQDLNKIQPMMFRAMENCMHETYMDCPFYEQLMYVGDTRLEVLTTYNITKDQRLPFRALNLFDWSRSVWDGVVAEHYPGRGSQLSCTFSSIYPMMVRDYMMYRRFPEKEDFLRLRRGVRNVIINLAGYLNEESLIENLAGWSFTDWIPEWQAGTPGSANRGKHAIYSLHFLMAVKAAMELEDAGSGMNVYYKEVFDRTAAAVLKTFWREDTGMFSDDETENIFSWHVQCFALLAGISPDPGRNLDVMLSGKVQMLTLPTLYFIYYLFETLYQYGRGELIQKYKYIWTDMLAKGAVTTWECPEPTRSDCHAWGAHLYHHYFASVAGIRPDSAGFRTVRIKPALGSLETVSGEMPHPDGIISFCMTPSSAKIILPVGCTGIYCRNDGTEAALHDGENFIPLK